MVGEIELITGTCEFWGGGVLNPEEPPPQPASKKLTLRQKNI
jgi:hypothetical protein